MPSLKNKRQQRVSQGRKNKEQTATKSVNSSTKRTVLFPEPEVDHITEPITAEAAKAILGWQEEGDDKKHEFGKKFLLKCNDKKVRCKNNISNRPLYASHIDLLKQEILRKRWRFNG